MPDGAARRGGRAAPADAGPDGPDPRRAPAAADPGGAAVHAPTPTRSTPRGWRSCSRRPSAWPSLRALVRWPRGPAGDQPGGADLRQRAVGAGRHRCSRSSTRSTRTGSCASRTTARPAPTPEPALQEWAAREPRIRLLLLEENQGISGATNAALADRDRLSSSGFIDHDDLLKPHALAEVASRLVADPTLDLVYTDEDKMDVQGRLISPFFKPDWSPEHLTSRNYMSHLTVARRSLVEQVGGLRTGFDGSQDHDLLLRLDRADRPGARTSPSRSTPGGRSPGSTAAVVDAKPYAFDASKRALDEALARRGYTGQATGRDPGEHLPAALRRDRLAEGHDHHPDPQRRGAAAAGDRLGPGEEHLPATTRSSSSTTRATTRGRWPTSRPSAAGCCATRTASTTRG